MQSATRFIVVTIFTMGLLNAAGIAAERAKFRTDADGPVKANEDEKARAKAGLPDWYRLVEGQFPPADSAHAVSGELIWLDPLERHFQIRVDRNDSQDRGFWDLPLDATLLPYGAIYYCGAPAALPDIPLNTHLNGQFYRQDPDDKSLPPPGPYNRRTPESMFRHCFRIEDDFSFHASRKELWQIESVDLTLMKLSATLYQNDKAVGATKTFDLLPGTRILKGTGFSDLKELAKGQRVLFNLTWVTLYGPGRITDLWLDEASRQLASEQQVQKHRTYIRERGLPGWVSAVDDDQQIVTITFFDGVDSSLLDELGKPEAIKSDTPPTASIGVARPSLMTYDPLNDKRGGNIVEIKRITPKPGSSGVQISVKCDIMLEGFRPHRIVRVFPGGWKLIALPREEQYFGRD